MNESTLYWLVGVMVPASVAYAIKVHLMIAKNNEDTASIRAILSNPEKHGFGTRNTERIIEDNTRAMKALTHYIQWLAESQSGTSPPPPLEGV